MRMKERYIFAEEDPPEDTITATNNNARQVSQNKKKHPPIPKASTPVPQMPQMTPVGVAAADVEVEDLSD